MRRPIDSIYKTRLSKLVRTKRLGKSIYVFDQLDSTQDYADSLPYNESLHGTIVIAKKQNLGKGRMGRTWISPDGGLWMSIIFMPDFSVDNIIFTQFIGALAVADAIHENTKINCRLKWPNDVLVNAKKVCGILVDVDIENENKKIIMGIGLNANIESSSINNYLTNDNLKATTLKEEYGNDIDLIFLTKSILERMEYYYENFLSNGRTLEIIERWKEKSDIFGKKAIVYDGTQKVMGEVIDIDQNGALIIKLSDTSIKKINYYSNVLFL
ncbi:MAG TPA: biotin--[acetyl-CoA-carboxylase] ligase [Nitrososphaeraceae archaeon]|jgi:BirA family biotin operon repressor/biotin-[acetyl-CoA-carboxylase] ligase|nr:biotin--[acetyl-CoA-carboxylase] ligase [Nitrososphaeraceae archaeon]